MFDLLSLRTKTYFTGQGEKWIENASMGRSPLYIQFVGYRGLIFV